jgi:hypothetical protein
MVIDDSFPRSPNDGLVVLVDWGMGSATPPYLFLHAMWNPTIRWRNKEFRLKWGGVAEPIPQSTRTTKPSLGLLGKESSITIFFPQEDDLSLPLKVKL